MAELITSDAIITLGVFSFYGISGFFIGYILANFFGHGKAKEEFIDWGPGEGGEERERRFQENLKNVPPEYQRLAQTLYALGNYVLGVSNAAYTGDPKETYKEIRRGVGQNLYSAAYYLKAASEDIILKRGKTTASLRIGGAYRALEEAKQILDKTRGKLPPELENQILELEKQLHEIDSNYGLGSTR